MLVKVIYCASEKLQKELIEKGLEGTKRQEVYLEIEKSSRAYEEIKVTKEGEPYLCFCDKVFGYQRAKEATPMLVLKNVEKKVWRVKNRKLEEKTIFAGQYEKLEGWYRATPNEESVFDEIPTIETIEKKLFGDEKKLKEENEKRKREAEERLREKIKEATKEGWDIEYPEEEMKKIEKEEEEEKKQKEMKEREWAKWVMEYGSELAKARLENGYEWIEVYKKEYAQKVIKDLNINLKEISSELYINSKRRWETPSLEAMNLEKEVREKIKNIDEATCGLGVFRVDNEEVAIYAYTLWIEIYDSLFVYEFEREEI